MGAPEQPSFAKSANYSRPLDQKKLSEILDSLSQKLDIEFGSLTVHFHQGKWTSKLEIRKNFMEVVE